MNLITVGIAMVSRFFFSLVGLFIAGFVDAQQPQPPVAVQSPVAQPADANRFFCSFACTLGACAVSQAVFNRCKQCPQTQVSGCLMAASGVPVEAAKAAVNAGTLLPPPGNCPPPEGKGGKGASGSDDGDAHDGDEAADGEDSKKAGDGEDSEKAADGEDSEKAADGDEGGSEAHSGDEAGDEGADASGSAGGEE